ncbi:MAG: NADH-quinone oxidoreductase subunit N [Planctomycetes bacterium]|jgi:NADH-quinone oxidoreductase subunit N|nr:NADH-quinone oxidoreductase subunit N [Planctomycetota bacterium]MBT6452805.1 NADH-quinone oxidoreductase subunit N [Planctomycetota bacterium]MBT6785292.1 NADH-quinone oxidoreductase subunit N [Planctomycetota bacterium]MBT6967580.1 NADH-quinone oxidoreductase subunit N [Planctomycetota bacterium]MBT7131034.1 NADH-quinone oxidoreductase subunit N [Planctomycetota bacterium]
MELTISGAEILAILPAAILVVTGLVQLFADLGRSAEDKHSEKTHLAMIGVTGFLLAFAALFVQGSGASAGELYAGAMTDDLFGRMGAGVVIMTGLFSTLMAGSYLASRGSNSAEFTALISFGAGSMALLCQATNLISIFVAIETLSLAVYVMAGYFKDERAASEGAFKYFVLGAFSSGFLLLGMAFIYGATGGSVALTDIAASNGQQDTLFSVGTLLVLIGFAFKVGAVPFHSWVPDVYQGAPVVAVGWMAVAVKASSLFCLCRFLLFTGGGNDLAQLLAAISVVTILLGNLAALNQQSLKRMMAYSGIAHTGYLLIPLVVALSGDGSSSAASIPFYMFAYAATTLAAFGVLAAISVGSDRDQVHDLDGLAKNRPLLALGFTVALLSLAGIPLTAGFIGKLLILSNAIQQGFLLLALVGIIGSLISVYYYLRPVVSMWFREPKSSFELVPASWGITFTVALCGFATICFGLFPDWLIDLSKRSVEAILG